MEIIKILVMSILTLMISGCAVAPKYSAKPIEVTSSSISDYWSYHPRLNKRRFLMGSNKACYRVVPEKQDTKFKTVLSAKISLIIDSEGRTFNHKLLSGVGNSSIDNYLLDMSSDLKWIPAERNSNLQPTIYTETYNFISDPETCRSPKSPEDFISLSGKEIMYQINLY